MIEKFKEILWANADCANLVEHLLSCGAITDKSMRDYVIKYEFRERWRNGKESQNNIIADIAADNDISFSAVYKIVK